MRFILKGRYLPSIAVLSSAVVGRFDCKSVRFAFPLFFDFLEQCSSSQRFKSPGKVVRSRELAGMLPKVLVRGEAIQLIGSFLEPPVLAFHLPVRPGLVHFGETVPGLSGAADAIEDMPRGPSNLLRMVNCRPSSVGMVWVL